jgi:hypothetical protein
MLDVIKEYLVSLGFKTDDSSLNTAKKAMKSAEDSVGSFSNSSVKNFAKAATAVVSFVATANLALGKFLVSLGQSDLQTEMFARRMWMFKDAAKAYQASIDALGVSIDDLYLSPELMDKFFELNKQAREMAVPAEEYNKQMQGVRDITFQFQRLKLEGMYALQWIGYYLTKYLAGPLGDTKDWLTKVNDEIQKDMPEWTKKVAMVASWVVRLGKAAWSVRSGLGAVLGVLAGFKMITLLMNPLGLFILGLTTLLLLIDDYNAFENDKSGKSSVFNDLWRAVDKFKTSLKDNGYIKDFKTIIQDVLTLISRLEGLLDKIGKSKEFQKLVEDVKEIFYKAGEIAKSTGKWFKDFFETISKNGDLTNLKDDTWDLVDSMLQLLSTIESLSLKLGEGGIGDSIKHNLVNALEIVDGLTKSIAGSLQIIDGILSGSTSKVNGGIGKFIQGADDAMLGPVEGKKAWDWQKKQGDNFSKHSTGDTFSNALKNAQNSPWTKFLDSLGFDSSGALSKFMGQGASQTSYETPTDHWISFKNSIPGANTDASTVNWTALKKGFVAFMNSIPKEFGEITKGLFQVAQGYGDSSAILGTSGASYMSYLYPQSSTSHITQITMKPSYTIYGASDPHSVATTVNRTNNAMLTRFNQGVIR